MLGSYIRARKLDAVIAAIVYPDRRGGGFGIGRYEDHPRLDFSRLEGQPDVHSQPAMASRVAESHSTAVWKPRSAKPAPPGWPS